MDNLKIILKSRPKGWVTEDNFAIIEEKIELKDKSKILVENIWLSLDPYMRGRMNDSKSYAKPVEINEVMTGATVGRIIESADNNYPVGKYVLGNLGWQKYCVTATSEIEIIEDDIPLQYYLGVCGMPGATAWIGLNEYLKPIAGETLVINAATGAVASVVSQLAKASGCNIVGIAGGQKKCDYALESLGYNACINYKSEDFFKNLKSACSAGIDCLFENVGGKIFDNSLRLLNPFSRIALCGLIADYNLTEPYGIKNYRSLLVNRVSLRGFIVFDNQSLYKKALSEIKKLILDNKLTYKETITDNLENAPKAFIGLLQGENFGKQLIKL